MLAARITLAHLSVSSAMSLPLVQSFEHRIAITTLAAREHEHSTHQDPALPVWRA